MKTVVNPKARKEKKGERENRRDKFFKNSKTINPTILIITLNVNPLNNVIKTQRLLNWILCETQLLAA